MPASMQDWISSLPDEIICHILSFLPTEQAVFTSVLSKRWRPLWTSVPVLDFSNRIQTRLKIKKPSYCFDRLIYATMQARDAQQAITTFHLVYDIVDHNDKRASADISVWVNTAIRRGVENLDINLKFMNQQWGGPYMVSLSSSIFTCRTLVVLKLKEVHLVACSSLHLPSLKILDLGSVEFEEPQCIIDLLSSCPMLEDFITDWIRYDCYGPFCKERIKKILPKLVKADLRFVGLKNLVYYGTNILFNAISNVEFMTIEGYDEDGELGIDEYVVAEFPHLRHLAISFHSVKNYRVLLMLKNFPKLQSFELAATLEVEDVLPNLDIVPECLTSCLTQCYLKFYRGTESELQFAKYILQNSTYLRSMKIPRVSPYSFEVLKELASCPRKSVSCKLSFDL